MTSTGPLRLTFRESASNVGTLPMTAAEVAFVGRSNVGKSSLINALAHRKQLARVSNTPGRTQLINLFEVDEQGASGLRTVVDLPGYGYAKAAKVVRGGWSAMIEGYLLERRGLVTVFVLIDGAIGPTALDERMLDWLRFHVVAHVVVATKWDKVRSSKRAARRNELAAGCRLDPDDVVFVSATKNEGVDALRSLVRLHLFG